MVTGFLEFGKEPFKGLCTNIGFLESDGAYNVIPTQTEIKFSMRPPPGDIVADRARDLEEITAHIAPNGEMIKIVQLDPFASHNVDAFAPMFADMFDVVDLPYWTEAALPSEAGVNCVVFGPGNLDQAHKPDEYVQKDQLAIAAGIYARVLSGNF